MCICVCLGKISEDKLTYNYQEKVYNPDVDKTVDEDLSDTEEDKAPLLRQRMV